MKQVFRFLKLYKLLSLVIIGLVAGVITYLLKLHTIADWILSLAIIVAVVPLLWGMVGTLRTGKYGIDILAATAMVTSVILGQYWAGVIIALMLTGGEALEDFAGDRAKRELTALLNARPIIAHLIKGKEIDDVKVGIVKVNDKLSILPGEVIPVDCEIIEGETSVNEANITGESLPRDKSVGDKLLAGTVNLDGAIKVRATQTAEFSQFEQIIKLVKSATSSDAPFIRLADRYSIPFTIVAFIIAGGVWFTSGHAIRFLEIIVVATPCPLLLAAPIALISGVSRASKHGIIIKNGTILEKLAEVKTVAFDKTGTLTLGKPIIDKVETYFNFTKNDVLKFASALEQNSNHVLAQTVISYTKSKKIKFQAAKQVREISGHGLVGRLQGRDLLIGHIKLIRDNNIELPKNFKADVANGTTAYLAVDGKLAGSIAFSDEIRPEAASMLDRLKKLKIKNFLIVTGDSLSATKNISKKLGIKDIRVDCLPVDKMTAIEGVEHKPVAFVGDGVNDAPVLTISDVGIALGAKGSTAASESADVVIMKDDVSKVASCFEIAKRTFFIAKQSILIGIFISIGLMLVFATGRFKPIYGAILQEVVDVVVIFNALRAHGAWQKIRNSESENKL